LRARQPSFRDRNVVLSIQERTARNLEVIADVIEHSKLTSKRARYSKAAASVDESLPSTGQKDDIDVELLGDILAMARGLSEWPRLSEKERVRRVLLAYERHSGQVRRQRTSILRLLRAG
jgi:hypothetical protein